jgi:beta-lactamase regulating signal transducer with metallopeptidase domain
VTERPDVIFTAVLVLAATAAAALLGVLVEIGLQGVAGIAAVSAGLVSACTRFALEIRDIPPALVFVSAIAIASGVALARALRAVWREQRLIQSLPAVALAESAYRGTLPSESGVDVFVLRARWQGAFCGGVLRPRVVVTTELLDALDPAERDAVLAHELSHARGRGPLKLVLSLVAVRSLFWVPVLRDLVDRHLLLTELAADRAAVAATSRTALAGALSQMLETPKLAGSIGFADHASARIDRLFDPSAKLPRLLTPARTALTALALATVSVLVYSSPRLTSSESVQLHAMTINLLAHHLQARLIGFAFTAMAVSGMIVGVRGLSRRVAAHGRSRTADPGR